MEFHFSPADVAFVIAVAFLFGIISASLAWNTGVIVVAIIVVGATVTAFRRYFWRITLAFFAATIAGMFYFHFYVGYTARQIHLPFDKKVSFTAIIIDEPTPSDNADVLNVAAQKPLSGDLMVLVPPGSGLRYGDLVKISGSIKPPDTLGGESMAFSQKVSVLAEHRGFWLREKLIDLKLGILEKFNEVLPQEQAALLGGITFGSKVNFSPELKKDMALAGVTHMVAISGYNITIIIVSVGELFGRLVSRRMNFYLIIFFIILFILMSGIQASAIRAAIMGFLALLAREMGKTYDIRNSITLTALVMALQDPTILMQDAGFQLSFLSLLGIVYFQKPVQHMFRYQEAGFLGWKENAVTTFSAQLGVLPVLVATFGQFSLTAVGANILVLGTVPLTMLFGFALAPLGFISSSLAFFAGKLAGFLLGYQLAVIKLFAALAVPLPIVFNSAFAVIFYYSLIITFAITYGDPEEN